MKITDVPLIWDPVRFCIVSPLMTTYFESSILRNDFPAQLEDWIRKSSIRISPCVSKSMRSFIDEEFRIDTFQKMIGLSFKFWIEINAC